PALKGRAHHLGECRYRLCAVQSQEGQPAHQRDQDVATAEALSAHGAGPAQQRPGLPAQPSARELARLPVLGYRARALGSTLDLPITIIASIRGGTNG